MTLPTEPSGPHAEVPDGPADGRAMEHPSKSCEHAFASHLRGGTGFFIRQCALCGAYDWDDVAAQVARISAEAWERGYMHAFNRDRAKARDEPCPDYLRAALDDWNPHIP